jgi:hypothetical protein
MPHTMPFHSLDFITWIKLGKENKSWGSSQCNFLQAFVTLYLLGLEYIMDNGILSLRVNSGREWSYLLVIIQYLSYSCAQICFCATHVLL